jgi:polyisoprenoid-binding protein YceI
MFRSVIAAAAAVSLLAVPVAMAAPGVASKAVADLPAGNYVLDKTHASLTAKIGHMGFSNYTVRFNSLDASFSFDPAKPTESKIVATVNPASIDTGSVSFNGDLSGAKWLNADKFPVITFTSTGLTITGANTGKMTGDLNFLGVTKPVTLDVVWNGVGSGMMGGTRTGFSATGSIKRTDYGFNTYVPVIGDQVDLLIEVEFTKK